MAEQLFEKPDGDGAGSESGGDGYRVIARRYRPSTFDDVIGQEHVTRTLKNAIRENRLGHAYLFSGPRGIGKTSTARILARAINCERGVSPDPCNECSVCRELEIGSTPDIVEIDAASQRGIDDIRNLRETVRYSPLNSQYRVYIIDEAHMLSKDAFNAFLKTLEEPPDHVVFVFATTEPEKMPDTIISRCQPFQFKRIPHANMLDRLRAIADAEDLTVSDAILSDVCRAVDGSLRDAQSILDQLISISGEEIEERDLKLVLGTVPSDVLDQVLEGIHRNDPPVVLEEIHDVYSGGGEIDVFLDQFISHLRDLLIVKSCGAGTELVDASGPNRERLARQAEWFKRDRIAAVIEALVDTRSRTDNLYQSRILLETALVRLCVDGDDETSAEDDPDRAPDGESPSGGSYDADDTDTDAPGSVREPDRQEDGEASSSSSADDGTSAGARAGSPEGDGNTAEPEEVEGTNEGEAPSSVEEVRNAWDRVVNELKADAPTTAALLDEASPAAIEDGVIELSFPDGFEYHRDKLDTSERRDEVVEVVRRVVHHTCDISFSEERGDRPEDRQEPPEDESTGTADEDSPAHSSRSDPEEDPDVRKVIESFDADIIQVED